MFRFFLKCTCFVVAIAALPCCGFAQGGHPMAGPAEAGASRTAGTMILSLDEAIHRAEQNEPNYANAVAAKGAAARERSIAQSALLPNVHYHNEYFYTEANGTVDSTGRRGAGNPFVFVANNAIHEYISQVIANETVSLAAIDQVKRAGAAAAQASARAEVARRGLVFAVVQMYYGLLAADQKVQVARQAESEANRFVALTQKLEHGQEVAHADVIKAELQAQQRQRDLENARLLAENARLQLGILLFPDPRTRYDLEDDLKPPPPVPSRADVEAAARRNNPDARSALAALHVADEDVSIARAAYLPQLSLNWTFGIDAPEFATYGPLDTSLDPSVKPRNLGYSAYATLDIPVWDWLATHNRVKQGELRRTAAATALSFTQKRLLADLDAYYDEAEVAWRQVASLGQSVRTAKDSLRLSNLRYQAGEATVLEVVDGQTALIQVETAYADGIVRYRAALANLQTLTGVLP